jgi:hypothetical protein
MLDDAGHRRHNQSWRSSGFLLLLLLLRSAILVTLSWELCADEKV